MTTYRAVPASDAHAGIFQEIATAPVALTTHALPGLALIGTAVLLTPPAAWPATPSNGSWFARD